ncbi:MAG: KamA family radical SAM protein [Lentisphaeria bacterium]|nr:KamA family radical SAM protein [Candidatus Neomarinimicrobiota bacterium]MCF7842322.1 KamA family radical SAM protein [Lentisphaeria bacterium]
MTVGDLPEEIAEVPRLQPLVGEAIPDPIKDPVDESELVHRDFEEDAFWKHIPAFRDVTREEFLDYKFQNKNSVTKVKDLQEMLQGLASPEFIKDIGDGMAQAPMNMRLSPYVLSLIDWENPYDDPLRRQFIPVASTVVKNHPKLSLDSLHEQEDSPTPGLVHRYIDKALFLPLDVCPVYCRFCTRSYAIGTDTDSVEKVNYKSNPKHWNKAFAYLASRPEIEDVVISGGDTYMLSAQRVKDIGETLLAIPHIRRLRFATKGPAIMPMKILTDHDWTDALVGVVEQGRKMGKEVVLHTHFNTVNEITDISREAMNLLFKRGVKVRNQSVLIRGVNDNADKMINLVKQLSYMNVQPYYVYQHDMVQGVEELRTRIADTVEIERHVRGVTAGFNTPTFVTDVPGGGGKRDVHSYDYYDEVTGVSVYRSPSVDEDKVYLYFDPIDLLPPEGQARWADPKEHDAIVEEAIRAAGLSDLDLAVE